MYLTTTETEILELFVNNIYLGISINSIAKKLKKHYRVVRVNVLSLIKRNLLNSHELAGARIISLNIKDVFLATYMPYAEEAFSFDEIFKILPQVDDIIKKAREISPFFILGIFGSYAENTQKKGSDIDFFLICHKDNAKKYMNIINQFPAIQELIHWNVFTIEEFKEGLKAKGTLIYKEIIKNKRIIKGAEIFYNLIAEVGTIEQN
ncbi:MAG: nucleotidyltransferase domain-containing protein [archaeon]